MITLILAVTLSVVVSALCSLLESVLYSTRAITLEAAASQGQAWAKQMQRFKSQVDRPLSAILILNTLANTAGASLAGWAAGEVWGPSSLWIFSLAFTMTILICSEIVPKTVGAIYWRRMWPLSVPPLMGMVVLTSPLIALTRGITRLITRGGSSSPRISEDEVLAAVKLSEKGGQISRLERDLIHNIIQLEEVRALDIMTPRTVMFSVDGNLSVEEVRRPAGQWPHTRVPVYLGGPEEIIGYVLKSDLLASESITQETRIKDLVQPVHFVPGSANALSLLSSFLRQRHHVALVVDEFGGIMGLITLEDVVETLVGSEIVDEKDQVVDMQELARGRARHMLENDPDKE